MWNQNHWEKMILSGIFMQKSLLSSVLYIPILCIIIIFKLIIFRESILEITKGIREYFNISLGLQLLYKWERPQFIQIMNDNPETLPSQLYGAFHLLRLFGIIFIQIKKL